MMNLIERNELRKRRAALFQEQNTLNSEHCHPCRMAARKTGGFSAEKCIECPINRKLMDIGTKLMSISRNSEKEVIKVNEPAVPNTVSLTVEVYKDLKAKGHIDKQIASMHGMSPQKLTAWKKENNLIVHKASTEEPLFKNSEIAKIVDGAATLSIETENLKEQLLSQEETIMSLSQANGDLSMQLSEAYEEIEALRNELESYYHLANGRASSNEEAAKRLKQLNRLLMQELLETESEIEEHL